MALSDFLGGGMDDPRSQSLLALGLGLLGTKSSNFGQALGGAGMQGMQAYQMAQDRQRQGKRDEQHARMLSIQEQMANMQMEQAKRQQAQAAAREALARQHMRPGVRPQTMDDRDVGQPGEQAVPPGQFDYSGYANSLAAIDPMQALQLKTALTKDDTPIALGDGGMLVRKDGTVVAENKKTPQEDEFVRNMRAAGIDPMSPQGRQLLQRYLSKQSSHAPGVSVSYGAPVAGVGPDGQPVFFQPDKSGGAPAIIPGVRPTPPAVSASTKEKIAENNVVLSKINDALALVESNGKSLGLQNMLGDTVMQRLDPSGVEVRAAVADIGSQKIHDRSGAAVTVAEAPRLKPFVPLATDNPNTVAIKLRRFQKEYQAVQRELQSGASIGQAAGKSSDMTLPDQSAIDAELARRGRK